MTCPRPFPWRAILTCPTLNGSTLYSPRSNAIKKVIYNQCTFMLFSRMFANQNLRRPPRFLHSPLSLFDFPFLPKLFRINIYEISRKCCRQRTYRIAKSFRFHTDKKQGVGSVIVNQLPRSSRVPSRKGAVAAKGTRPSALRFLCFLCVSALDSSLYQSPITSRLPHPPVPNGTAPLPLLHAYNHCAILSCLRPGDRPFAPSWRSL